MSKNMELFKERITKSQYSELIKEISSALDAGDAATKDLLFGTTELKEYTARTKGHGYQYGQHCSCDGLKEESYTEKRLCKCLYYFNSQHSTKCESCDFRNRYTIDGEYFIKDYEVPAFYSGKGVGEIDLVLSDDDIEYATEVKPAKDEFDPNDEGNQETLLRMIAEIMTYTYGYSEGRFKKAIGFFEDTPQEKEYHNASQDLLNLLKKADITVFQFVKAGEKTYRICKL